MAPSTMIVPAARSRTFLRAALLCLLCVFATSGCGASNSGGLTLTGSTSVTPFAEQLAEHYQAEHTGSAINVQGLGSSAGIRATLDGVSEIGMSSRDLKADEADQLDQAIIARDALAIIVHPSNSVGNLSIEQIQGIFTGAIRSWDQVGGPAQPIVLVSREAGSGTFTAFEELVMDGKPLTTSALRQGSNGAIRQIVADDPEAIGYISLGIVDASVKAVAVGDVAPSVEHVEQGSYRLVRPFLFVWRKGQSLSPLASSFLEYVLSEPGQQLLLAAGLVPGEVAP